MFDLIVSGAQVVDGTGAQPFAADVGISAGRIVEVGPLKGRRARRRIAAAGLHLSPGFIDIHSHDDFNLPLNPLAEGKKRQGVTTVVMGNCGFSPAPVLPARRKMLGEVCSFLDSGLDFGWESFADFLAAFPATAVNTAPLVGHVPIRCAAMGVEERPPTPEELQAMQAMVGEAMAAGAHGFSTGLIYPPSCYADTAEITALAAVAARHGGGYFTHMRDEGAGIAESIAEAVAVGKGSGARVQIAHLKLTNPGNWGRAAEILALIDRARAEGLALHCDQYPYTAASTGMKTLLPQWVHAGGGEGLESRLKEPAARARIRREVLSGVEGGALRVATWEDAVVSDSPSRPEYAGVNLAQVGEREGKAPVDALLDLLLADKGKTLGIFFSMGEADVFEIMRHPAVAIGSDGIFLGVPGRPDPSRPHPRHFGTFPRVAGRYTREPPVLPLAEAVRKMTSLPAAILGLPGRGRIAPDYVADLVLFDAGRLIDRATFEQPRNAPEGVHTVLVGGVPVVEEGEPTAATPGRMLRHGA